MTSRSEPPRRAVAAWTANSTGNGRSRYVDSQQRRYTTLVALLDQLPFSPGARVLEIGAGDGFISQFLQKRYGWIVTGIDCLEDDVALCRERGIRSEVCNLDTDDMPFGDRAFDLVLFDSVLEHLYTPRRGIREATRVLVPGGTMVVGTPNATALVQRLKTLAGMNPFSRFNRFNAIEGGVFMRECAVFYTVDEVIEAFGPTMKLHSAHWTDLFDPNRPDRPAWRNWVTPLRLAACRVHPPFSDFFYLSLNKEMLPTAER